MRENPKKFLRRAGIALLFLVLWAFFFYRLEDVRPVLIWLPLFLLLLLIPKMEQRLLTFWIFLMAFVLANSSILGFYASIFEKLDEIVREPKQAALNVLTPGSGKEFLTQPVANALSLLEKHQLQEFNLSEAIRRNALVHQPLVEVAWPRKLREDNKQNIIFGIEEEIPAGCEEVDSNGEIKLVHCAAPD